MKIEDQVISVSQAKRLKELGFEQTGAMYYWYEEIINGCRKMALYPLWIKTWSEDEDSDIIVSALSGESKNEIYAAFTVAELGIMLPSEVYTRYTGSSPNRNAPWEWVDDSCRSAMGIYDTEAEARGALLIHLLESNTITPEEANNRLTNSVTAK